MRKRKNKENVDKINQVKKPRKKTQGILPKKKDRRKIKAEIKTEIKQPRALPPLVIYEKVKAAKRKRKNKININEINKKLKEKVGKKKKN